KHVLEHLKREGEKDPSVALVHSRLQCQIAAKTKDVPALEDCTAALTKAAPDDPRTVIFQWSLAVQQGRMKEAQRLIARAKELKVVPESLERMQSVTSSRSSHGRCWRSRSA